MLIKKISSETGNGTLDLALDTIELGKQALVFVNTKRSAEKTAEDISSKIKTNDETLKELSEKPETSAEDLKKAAEETLTSAQKIGEVLAAQQKEEGQGKKEEQGNAKDEKADKDKKTEDKGKAEEGEVVKE